MLGPVRLTSGLHFSYRRLILPPVQRRSRRNGSLRYLFEEYAFDTDRRELHRGTDAVSITAQVFDSALNPPSDGAASVDVWSTPIN